MNEEYLKAIKDLYKSYENGPSITYESDIHYHLGISYANMELYEQAIEPLTKAIQLMKTEACYIHERAKCYLLVDQYELSVKDFDRVIEL